MADPELTSDNVSELPRRVPPGLTVKIVQGGNLPPHSPREMAMVEASTGKSMGDLAGSAAFGEQLAAFLTLRRMGYDATWEDAFDVMIDYVEATPPAPAPPPTTSPASATSGA